ncbi:pteridine reductase [Trypanosoma conorhini]|uniref:Pteridine reductase n=1 Tax=Trypanosoma conorhini TaxID=83891 RepID=A0A422NVJ1_9TRYP|nr:pteridine reductase [Trypanosoma conorhini]RNF09476.1 pteridine reductase [Trypanosoma conorhini]
MGHGAAAAAARRRVKPPSTPTEGGSECETVCVRVCGVAEKKVAECCRGKMLLSVVRRGCVALRCVLARWAPFCRPAPGITPPPPLVTAFCRLFLLEEGKGGKRRGKERERGEWLECRVQPRRVRRPLSPGRRGASAAASPCGCTGGGFELSCTTATPNRRRSVSSRSSTPPVPSLPRRAGGGLGLGGPLLECCEGIIDCSFRAFGRCDVLVNNASAYCPTPLLPGDDTGDAAGAQPFDVRVAELLGSNAVAPLFLIRAFARRQAEVGGSEGRDLSVVNLCDAMADLPLPGFSAYTMAKHALDGLTRAAALELAPRHIRVNAVAPGLGPLPPAMPQATREEYRRNVPLGQREASAAEIADAVAFLVSKDAAYITGATLKVDGGLSLARA